MDQINRNIKATLFHRNRSGQTVHRLEQLVLIQGKEVVKHFIELFTI